MEQPPIVESDSNSDNEPKAEERTVVLGFWNRPTSSLIVEFWENRASVLSFLSLTRGSILYCVSAFCILYGIGQIIGPTLAKSNVLGEILPCFFVLNVYEIALLGVLVLIVMWKNVTDDAISLIVLVGLLLIASGVALGTVTTSGPNVCLYIGLAAIVLGMGKLYAMRRFIGFKLGVLSFLGMALILTWNFLGSSIMAKLMIAKLATDEMRRLHWQVSWIVVLIGGIFILIESARSEETRSLLKRRKGKFLRSGSMVWIFALVVLSAAGIHQYAAMYMFAVDGAFGDYILLIGLCSLLSIELMRSFERQFWALKLLAGLSGLGCVFYAMLSRSIMSSWGFSLELLWYPPVMLGLIGAGLVCLGRYHGERWLLYVSSFYGLGVLLTIGFSPHRPFDLNWEVCAAGLVTALFVLGLVRKNFILCLCAVVILASSLGLSDTVARFAKLYGMTVGGVVAGIAGAGAVLVYLIFGRKLPRAVAVVGAVLLILSAFDFPGGLVFTDILVAAVTVVLCVLLWLRTRDIWVIVILCMPICERIYVFSRSMPSWGFIILSFPILFTGAAVSLFCKRRLEEEVTESQGTSDH